MLHARGALRRNAILEHASPVLGSGGQGRSGARGHAGERGGGQRPQAPLPTLVLRLAPGKAITAPSRP